MYHVKRMLTVVKLVSILAILGLFPVASSGLPARAAEVTELGSGQKFTTPLLIGGSNYSLLGVGLRSQQTGKDPKVLLYAMALYVDHAAAKIPFPALYGKAPTRAMMMAESRAQNFIIWGRFGKLAVLRFIRPRTRAELHAELQEGLSHSMTDKGAVELQRDADKFLALFDKDFKEGDEVRIHTDETGKIEVQVDGVKRPGPHNPKLARFIWEIWLGARATGKDMRMTLVDKLEILKK